MFIEAAVSLVGLGAMIGAGVTYLVMVEPHQRRSQSDRSRLIKAQAFLQVAREREHKGTPYIRKPEPLSLAAFEELAKQGLFNAMSDNTGWSKNADARVVSLPERRNRAV